MAEDGATTNVTETNAEEENKTTDTSETPKSNNVELALINTNTEENEGLDENSEKEEKKEEDYGAQETIHEDSEDSKFYYKLDDFELEYNVKGLRERFERIVEEYSGFDEDIYTVQERELMDVLGSLAIDSYGILLWILCMDQLETERKKIIWDILIFLAMRMPTQVAMDLLIHYSSNMARYSPTDVSELGKALVHGSQFPLATCLVLSAFFVEAAKKDLTRDKQLRELSQEYAIRATTILEEVENDYLAVIMLETPSFHNSKSPLEIALENDIIDFLACNKVSRVSNAMWTLPNLMQVGSDTQSAFALSDFAAADVHTALLNDSYSFYFSSMGYFTVEVVTYLLYLAMFTYLTHLRTPVSEPPTWIDYIFWGGNVGFVLGELIELAYDGLREYLSKWQNWLDMVISINFILIIILRSFVTIICGYINDTSDIKDEFCNNDGNNVISIVYKNIWALNVVILWLRLLHFMLLSRAVGPLITNIKNMLKDIASFGKMYVLILMGFVFGLYFLIGGEGKNVLFQSVSQSVITLVKTTLGQLEWECVRDVELGNSANNITTSLLSADGTETTATAQNPDCQCDYDGGCEYLAATDQTRGNLATILLIVFSLVTLVVLFNLLTAMMATTYRLITERSDKEVLSRKVAMGVEYDKQNQVMPPPFNMLVLILFLGYSIVDALLLLFTQKFISESYGKLQWKCENCNCLNEYIRDDDDDDDINDKLHSLDSVYAMDKNNENENDEIHRRLSAVQSNTSHVCQLCGKYQTTIKPKRRYWRNPRQYSEGDGRWKTFVMGLKELLDIKEKKKQNKGQRGSFKAHDKHVSNMEHHKDAVNNDMNDEDILDERMIMEKRIKRKDWICGFCRNRIPAGRLGDIETFKGRLFNDDVRVDEDDIEAIQQINPLLCPICYRVVSVRSRIIFIMEVISYAVFLFILYPVVRICLIPVYFFQAIYAWTGNEDKVTSKNDDTSAADGKLGNLDAIQNNMFGTNKNNLEELKKLKEIEELLPSDTQTRALLNPQHKIWKVLKHYQKKQNKIEVNEDAKIAHDKSVKAKRKRKMDEEKLQKQRGKIVAQLGVLIDKYWKTRLAASEKHRLEAKREKQRIKEIEALKSDIDYQKSNDL